MDQVQSQSVISFSDHPTVKANALQCRFENAEAIVDSAIRCASELLIDLMSAQRELGLSSAMGQPAVVFAIETIEKLGAARESLLQAHKKAQQIGRVNGINPSATGLPKPVSDPSQDTNAVAVS